MRQLKTNASTHHAPVFQKRLYKDFSILMPSLHTAVSILVGRLV